MCRNGICIEQHISTLDEINLFKAANNQANNSGKIKGEEAVDIQANHANN
nr:unnamed protein product [Meloidogyne enterolobii]